MKPEKLSVKAGVWIAMLVLLAQPVSAMHIMEGYLPIGHAVAWGAVSLPFLVWGVVSIRRIVAAHRKTLLLLAMMGAYGFVLSALKIPSVTGSSSHPTGTGLGAVLFGPGPMAVIGVIVLLFQAILLAHGGLTTLGANAFSMAIGGPLVSFGLYRLLNRFKVNRLVSVGIACGAGNLVTYCITAFQLGVAYPSQVGGVGASVLKFMGIFAVTQIPLAVIEGILSAVVVMMLQSFAKPELRELKILGDVQ